MRPVRAACGIASIGAVHQVVGADHLDLHLGQEVHDVFGAAVELGMALLPPEALGLDDGQALQPDLVQRVLHLVELEGLDDGLDLLHRLRFAIRALARRSTSVPASACRARPAPARRAGRAGRVGCFARARASGSIATAPRNSGPVRPEAAYSVGRLRSRSGSAACRRRIAGVAAGRARHGPPAAGHRPGRAPRHRKGRANEAPERPALGHRHHHLHGHERARRWSTARSTSARASPTTTGRRT